MVVKGGSRTGAVPPPPLVIVNFDCITRIYFVCVYNTCKCFILYYHHKNIGYSWREIKTTSRLQDFYRVGKAPPPGFAVTGSANASHVPDSLSLSLSPKGKMRVYESDTWLAKVCLWKNSRVVYLPAMQMFA